MAPNIFFFSFFGRSLKRWRLKEVEDVSELVGRRRMEELTDEKGQLVGVLGDGRTKEFTYSSGSVIVLLTTVPEGGLLKKMRLLMRLETLTKLIRGSFPQPTFV